MRRSDRTVHFNLSSALIEYLTTFGQCVWTGYLQMGDSSVVDEGMVAASKIETAVHEGTPSDLESTPEPDAHHEVSQEPAAQPQKRKGGRKPVSGDTERHIVILAY